MKLKLTKYERIAGIFLLGAIIGSIAATIGVAAKKGWFSRKISYETILENAEGIHPGTLVQMSGLRAGEVSDVELLNSEKVLVRIKVLDKFSVRVKSDSFIQVLRPFLIGEKVLDLTIGSEEAAVVSDGGSIASHASMDLMDLVSGRRMNDFLSSISRFVESFKVLTSAFADPRRTESLVKTMDHIEPLVKNLNTMAIGFEQISRSLNKNGRFENMAEGLAALSDELKTILPELNHEVPSLGRQLGQLVKSVTVLAKEFETLTPAIKEIAPDLPRTSRRAVEALDETVVLLKALQKSFLLRGNVKEVKEEESQRLPAADSTRP